MCLNLECSGFRVANVMPRKLERDGGELPQQPAPPLTLHTQEWGSFPMDGGREQSLGLEAIYNYETNTCVACSSSDTKQFAGSTTRVGSPKQTKVTQDNVSTHQERHLGQPP